MVGGYLLSGLDGGGGGVPTFPGLGGGTYSQVWMGGGVPTFPGLGGGVPTLRSGLGGVPTFPGPGGGSTYSGLDGGGYLPR